MVLLCKDLIQLFDFLIYWFLRPYDGRWSKSMIGYGAEDNHFVVELTYNYGLGSYAMGNDFQVCLSPFQE